MDLVDRVQVTVAAAPGLGPITPGPAVAGYKSFASVFEGARVPYLARDGDAWEIGRFLFNKAANTLTRFMSASSTGNLINLGAGTVVAVTARSVDIAPPWERVEAYNVIGDGVVDDSDNIQAAIDTGARIVQMGPGKPKVTKTLFLGDNQTVRGVGQGLSTVNAAGDANATTIQFAPAAADTLFMQKPGKISCGVENLAIRNVSAGANNWAIAFSGASYSNFVRNVNLIGDWDVGVYLNDTYVCDVRDIATNAARFKHYSILIGSFNCIRLEGVHTSGLPTDAAIRSVGIGVKGPGACLSLDDCVMQGQTLGFDFLSAESILMDNSYAENTVCNMRSGSDAVTVGTTVRGGKWSAPYAGHPQYASRGPLIIADGGRRLRLENLVFANSNFNTPSIYPIVWGPNLTDFSMSACHFFQSWARREIFRTSNTVSPFYQIDATPVETDSGNEILMKAVGNYGSNGFGFRFDAAGAMQAAAHPWQPAVLPGAIPALLSSAFYVPPAIP